MPQILDLYNELIQALDELFNPQNKKREDKNLVQVFATHMEGLHSIAIKMHYFKKSDGDLQNDYGQGILIEKFFQKFINDNKSIEELNHNWIKSLDDMIGKKRGIYYYRELEEEYQSFSAYTILDNSSTSAVDSTIIEAESSLNQVKLEINEDFYRERLTREREEEKQLTPSR